MIRTDKLKSELYGGVGFRQSPITDYAIVDVDNQQSDSGLFYQDTSGFVTIKNIKECQQAVDISDSDFNAYLKQMQETAIVEVSNKVTFDQSDMIQSITLYPYEKSFKNTIDNNSKFVGFIFEPRHSLDKLARINFIELCLNESITFNLYVYNSNLPETPVKTIPITTVANQATIVSTDIYLSDSELYKGGTFYLGYFQDDLNTAKAFKKDHDLSNYEVLTKCFNSRAVSLDYSGSRIDVESVNNESISFGLNAGVNIYMDYTELIIRNKNLFYNAIQLQMAEKVLNIIQSTTRSNDSTHNLDINLNGVLFDLYGHVKQGIEGIDTKLDKLIIDLKNMLFRKPLISRGTLR